MTGRSRKWRDSFKGSRTEVTAYQDDNRLLLKETKAREFSVKSMYKVLDQSPSAAFSYC